MKVIIPRGGSGAGKSTWIERTHPEALIFSADAFFINEEGVYGFDVTKLGEAHAWCFKSFINCCQSLVDDGEGVEDTVAVVDNTNTRIAEFAPYAQVALAFGHELQVITLVYDPVEAFKRNTHGTPLKSCMDQYRNLQEGSGQIPPWWNHDYVLI